MAGQSATKTRGEVISKLNSLEIGPNKTGSTNSNPNAGHEGMSAKVPTGQAGK